MTEHLTFPQFIDAVRGDRFEGNPQPSFQMRAPNDFFVNPDLVVKEDLGDLSADVILLSARGAAGKSTTGQQLSQELGVPLWKLEDDAAVSATALSHVLSRYMSTFEPEAEIARRGRPLILIDSLDEARARVSGTSWTEFLDSLAATSRQGARLVLLGRERTLEDVWLTLDDGGVRLAWLEISHFGPEERIAYVDGVTRRKAKDPAIVDSPTYTAARDAILGSLVGSLSGEAADAFAGYAPVLDAVAAVLYGEDNLFSVSKTFDAAKGGTRGLDELRKIIDGLLEREQRKVAPLAVDLGLAPEATYAPDEQIDWLCSELLDGATPELTYIADVLTRDAYIKRVSEFLKDHPFRSGEGWASVVFAAYIANRRFATIPGPELLRVGNDSGLLFDFHSLDGARGVVDELQFAALHASITAGEFSGVQAAVSATEQPSGEYETIMHLVRAGEAEEVQLTLITASPDILRLFGPLEAITVVSTGNVTIPARQPVTVLGPDLFVRCGSLTVEGGSVEFAHRAVPAGDMPQSGQVIFQVLGELHLPGEIARPPLPGDFELAVPDSTTLRYPWTAYRVNLEEEESADPSGRAERFLNMLMNLTRTHGHAGDRGCFIMKLQGRQSVKGEEFQRVVTTLANLGVVRVEREMIYLTAEYEPFRFSGKTTQGQRLIGDLWDTWGPVVDQIKKDLRD